MVANTRGRKSESGLPDPQLEPDPGLPPDTPHSGTPPPNTFGCGTDRQSVLEHRTASQADPRDLHDNQGIKHRVDDTSVAPSAVALASSDSSVLVASEPAHAVIVKQEPTWCGP